MTEKNCVFIVDDHSVVIEGITSLIARMGDFECIGSAIDGREAITAIKSLQPDIVILDVSMPVFNGIDIAEVIISWNRDIKILIYSMSASKEYIVTLFGMGVAGYVLKHEPISELRLALRTMVTGASFYSSEVREILQEHLKELESGEEGDAAAARNGIAGLSKRENEVFILLADGLTIKEIGARLGISPKTVESHKYNIMEKLDIESITGFTKIAFKKGLIDLE